MDSSISNNLNIRNIANIRYQINNKKGCNGYYSTDITNKNVITDYDSFPYNRWFRGEYNMNTPIIAEREAGWRPRNEMCYSSDFITDETRRKHGNINPAHYFQPPCSVVYPKYVSENDLSLSEVKLNENCVISYR